MQRMRREGVEGAPGLAEFFFFRVYECVCGIHELPRTLPVDTQRIPSDVAPVPVRRNFWPSWRVRDSYWLDLGSILSPVILKSIESESPSLGCRDRLPALTGPGTVSQVNDPESSE